MTSSVDMGWVVEALERLPKKSKRALARAIGIDNSALLKMLNGERRVQVHEIVAIANHLQMSRYEVLDRILGLPGDATRPVQTDPVDPKILENLIAHALQRNHELGAGWTPRRLAMAIVSAYRLWLEGQRAGGDQTTARDLFDQMTPARRQQ